MFRNRKINLQPWTAYDSTGIQLNAHNVSWNNNEVNNVNDIIKAMQLGQYW